MKKEIEVVRKFPRIGYAGTEGRLLQTFNTWATLSIVPQTAHEACGSKALYVTFGDTGIYRVWVHSTTQGVSFNGHQEKASFIKRRHHT